MNLILIINEDDTVVTCIKSLTAGEALVMDQLSRTIKGDVLSYQQMPLFAFRKGDLGFNLDRIMGQTADESADAPTNDGPSPASAPLKIHADQAGDQPPMFRKPQFG